MVQSSNVVIKPFLLLSCVFFITFVSAASNGVLIDNFPSDSNAVIIGQQPTQTGGGSISNGSLNNQYLNLSGTNANQNINIGVFNLTATWFKGLFNWTVTSLNPFLTSTFNGNTLTIDLNNSKFCLANGTGCAASGSTFNATYNNLLSQSCSSGKVVNGTYANGSLSCVTDQTGGGGGGNPFNQTLNTTSNVTFDWVNPNKINFSLKDQPAKVTWNEEQQQMLGVGLTLDGIEPGVIPAGTYYYTYSFVYPTGETILSQQYTLLDVSVDVNVSITDIPTGGAGCIARKIYRTNSGSYVMRLLTTINDCVTTSYIDTTQDADLGAAAYYYDRSSGNIYDHISVGTNGDYGMPAIWVYPESDLVANQPNGQYPILAWGYGGSDAAGQANYAEFVWQGYDLGGGALYLQDNRNNLLSMAVGAFSASSLSVSSGISAPYFRTNTGGDATNPGFSFGGTGTGWYNANGATTILDLRLVNTGSELYRVTSDGFMFEAYGNYNNRPNRVTIVPRASYSVGGNVLTNGTSTTVISDGSSPSSWLSEFGVGDEITLVGGTLHAIVVEVINNSMMRTDIPLESSGGGLPITKIQAGLRVTDEDGNLGNNTVLITQNRFTGKSRVGILTSDPDLELDINGSVIIRANLTFNGNVSGNISLTDGTNIKTGNVSGTRIGTDGGQKMAFWGATPIIQPTFDGNPLDTTLINLGLIQSTSANVRWGRTVQLNAGLVTASPLLWLNGSIRSTPTTGADEYMHDKRYFTIRTGSQRVEYVFTNNSLGSGVIPITAENGRLTNDTLNLNWTSSNKNLFVSNFTVGSLLSLQAQTKPTWVAAYNGTIIRDTADNCLYYGNSTAWNKVVC